MSIDPITLAIVQKRLDNIALQMGWVMTRTARSPIMSQSHDFSCFISDEKGIVLSQADGLPIHTGGGGYALRGLLSVYSSDISSDDVFLLSDPYEGGNNHLPDWTIIRPVFFEEQLMAFVCNRAHQSDIGGGAAGTYNSDATEIYHEGIRIPPVRLVEKGVVRDDLWRMLLLNSRCPDLLEGDLRAMLGSTKIGVERILALVTDLGVDDARTAFSEILNYGERMMANEIETLPDGEYEGVDFTDNDCFEKKELAVRVKLTINGSKLTIDFTGTDGQIRGFKNSTMANTVSSIAMALIAFLGNHLPKNEGTQRVFDVIAPEGSMVNAVAPAAVTMSTVYPAGNIIHALWQALAKADIDRACAGWGKIVHCITSGQNNDGKQFVLYHWHASVASGAIKGRDGVNTCGQITSLGARTLPNAEIYERVYPVIVRKQEFRTDGGGAGQYRGGTGVDYVAEVQVPATYSFRGEGYPALTAFGVNSGAPGKHGSARYVTVGGKEVEPPQYGVKDLAAVVIRFASPGGGGWGNPHKRPVNKVLDDIRNEIVSIDAARAEYGVVVEHRPGGLIVDEAETHRFRLQV